MPPNLLIEHKRGSTHPRVWVFGLFTLAAFALVTHAAETPAAAHFRKDIQPILNHYCSDCHADGEHKGNISFDSFKSDSELVGDHELWLKALANLRAGLMPPGKKPKPTPEEIKKVEAWIKYDAFQLDPKNPDPGRITVSRLNRTEYSNTIRDLMGIKFDADVEFPPDDTGYGFDNIGDVLTLSPMLLEKYLTAARTIVTEAVPIVSRVIPEKVLPGAEFHRIKEDGSLDTASRTNKDKFLALSYYQAAKASAVFPIAIDGSYRVTLELVAKGNFDYDPGRCKVVFKMDGQEELTKEFGWYDNKTFRFDFEKKWSKGDHQLFVEVTSLTPVDQKINSLDMRIASVTAYGPADKQYWVHPKNYERFFTAKDAPQKPSERKAFATQTLRAFAQKAFRRPLEDREVKRLVGLAESKYAQPGKTTEEGIAHAMVAVLASPQFLFRLEEAEKSPAKSPYANLNEYALASRLSYFLWSTMPDETLLQLASKGQLRKNLSAQVTRMLADSKSEQMVKNFVGQWLQTRDVDSVTINAGPIFARDNGNEKEIKAQQEAFRAQFARFNQPQTNSLTSTNALAQLNRGGRTNGTAVTNLVAMVNGVPSTNNAGRTNGLGRGNGQRPPGFRFPRPPAPPVELDRELRDAMRAETDMFVSSIVHEDRPVTDLIDSDYTFINARLAKVYAISNIVGTEMRRISLPTNSPRGGVLTQGSVLVATSNPDRTSPVKRGLFVLDNILGTPAPPPPANIPALEAAEKDFKDHEPTLREALQLHREKPLCASCHNRMDPIGLAFENFNALGMWREKERKQVIDAQGKLITGESFTDIRELKQILATKHRQDFYRCLTEKFLTYALGRGMEYYDVETIDQIVQRLERENGRFSALLNGVIESAPFQKQRKQGPPIQEDPKKTAEVKSGAKQVTQN